MFAVIETGGKQYSVCPEDVLKIEKIEGEAGDVVVFEKVLVLGEEGASGAMSVGQPSVSGARVSAEIIAQGRARKLIVFKKKRRKNQKRKNGHRQFQTTVRITKIECVPAA